MQVSHCPTIDTPPVNLTVERGPNCLFVRVPSAAASSERMGSPVDFDETLPDNKGQDFKGIATFLFELLDEHLVQRLVVEFDSDIEFDSTLLRELQKLDESLGERGRRLAFAGLSQAQLELLEPQGISHFVSRHDAAQSIPQNPH